MNEHPRHRLVLVMPVFNDWQALGLLLRELERELFAANLTAAVVVVDDASTIAPQRDLCDRALRAITSVEILRLACNLGHQRAIAIGLTFVHQERPCDAVVVMDADGEDRPQDVPRLVAELWARGSEQVVFAERVRRTEGLVFRCFYQAYRLLHRMLTGVSVKVGNFSAMPYRHLSTFVVLSDAWSHYAAAVFKARIPHVLLPTKRGRRLSGRSTMNFVSLVTHGLSAIAVFGDVVGVRILLAAFGAFAIVLCLLVGPMLIRLCTDLAIPGWTSTASALLVVISSQVLMVAFAVAFFILYNRNNLSFIPIREYRYFIAGLSHAHPLETSAASVSDG